MLTLALPKFQPQPTLGLIATPAWPLTRCVPCEGDVLPMILAALAIVATALVLVGLWRRCRRAAGRAIELGGWLWRLYTQLSLRAKIKQVRTMSTCPYPYTCPCLGPTGTVVLTDLLYLLTYSLAHYLTD